VKIRSKARRKKYGLDGRNYGDGRSIGWVVVVDLL
jgi:hypothetical protein